MEDSGYEISGYVARQSLISSFAPAGISTVDVEDHANRLESKFQSRSLLGDANSSLPGELRAKAKKIDCLLVDLVDERGGIWINDRGETLTNSLELTKSEIMKDNPGKFELLKLGDKRHLDLFRDSARSFARLLSELEIRDKSYFIVNYWAATSLEGDTFPFGTSRVSPSLMNPIYAKYFTILEEFFSHRLIYVPKSLCITTRNHQWGIAPFHYSDAFYRYIREAIMTMDESRTNEPD